MTVAQLTIGDLRKSPVWEFGLGEDGDDTAITPVRALPVRSLDGRIVGTQAVLANRRQVWTVVGNVKVKNPDLTKHLLSLSICKDRRWFHLARYHDSEYAMFGPKALGEFLGLPIGSIFPIRYDLSAHCIGHRDSLVNMIEKSPAVRLTRAEIIRLAVPRNPDR